ncbi:MAG: DEAD/DEAH box helicase [Candidatus Obscuribacterales bacterium]|nr:DEAD/DEAH box helicase [Candidatus Obscuribacterales bacterium]
MQKFAELGLSKPVLAALQDAGISEPTTIQRRTIGLILDGNNLLASAETGSGKTAAFGLPIVECLQEPGDKPRALVLVPTRELALQVSSQFKLFSKNLKLKVITLYGGAGMDQQLRSLRGNVDIIVATPGRLNDYLERKAVDLSNVEMLVLDEADRLLDLGFMPQVRRIISKVNKERQTLMFSATLDDRIGRLANEFSEDPVIVKVNTERVDAATVNQQFVHVTEFNKDALLLKLLGDFEAEAVLVFTRTKRKAGWVSDRLQDAKVVAEEIHGDLSQSQRERALKKFRTGEISVLVATDVAARGLDIPTISHVVNYDLPDTPEDYVHRIGRTGRAGKSGTAVSFISEEQRHLVRDIEKVVGRQLESTGTAGATPAVRKILPARRFRRGRR